MVRFEEMRMFVKVWEWFDRCYKFFYFF